MATDLVKQRSTLYYSSSASKQSKLDFIQFGQTVAKQYFSKVQTLKC